jgi:hypothetical protein
MQAQQPYVATPTIIPQNPSSNSIIKVLTKVTTANQGIVVDNNTHTINGLQIKIKGCYWQGMLTATQAYIDTLIIGQLLPGNYQVIQKAYLSTTQQHCSIIDSNQVSFTFNVSQFTGLAEELKNEAFYFYPNPCLNSLNFSLFSPDIEFFIYSYNAVLCKKGNLINKSINVSDLPNGIYFISIQDKDKNIFQTQKFLKLGE